MSKNIAALPKSLIIFSVCIPLALMVGYFLATPNEMMSFGIVGTVLVLLCIPLLLRWHYPALIFGWNANIAVFFLPGQPALWMLLAGVSLFLTVLACVMDKQIRFQNVPSITWPLVFFTSVVFVTGKLTGGIGLHVLGSGMYGGKKLVFIVASIIGYYALSAQRISAGRAERYTGLFFLSAITAVVSNLVYLAGPAFYVLYLFFPVDNAMSQAYEDFATIGAGARFTRLPGVSAAAMAVFYYALSRYGLRGLLDLAKPWRFVLLLACFAFSLLGGFRSALNIFALICAAQFCFEGLFRTRIFWALILCTVLGGAFLAVFATKLPLSVQRSLTVLPIEVDPAARADALASWEWRVDMWQILLPQVRQYFFIGKGYAINPTDLYLAEESTRRGLTRDFENSMIAGDYHSGPLSVIIPFGIFGLVGFVWVLLAGLRVLYRNYRYSEPALRNTNTFLLSYFVARFVFYFGGFGALSSDLAIFLGVMGLSIALNGGVRAK